MATADLDERLRPLLRRATVIVGDAVGEYYYAGTDQEEWSIYEDFPNVAPPLDFMFIEFNAPSQVVSERYGVQPWAPERPSAWGVLLCAQEIAPYVEDESRIASLEETVRHEAALVEPILQRARALGHGDLRTGLAYLSWAERKQLSTHAATVRCLEDYKDPAERARKLAEIRAGTAPRWGMEALLWGEYRTGPIGPRALWHYDFLVGGDGDVRPMSGDIWCRQGPQDRGIAAQLKEGGEQAFAEYDGYFSPWMHCVFLTLSFMHCKNVILREIDPLAAYRATQNGAPRQCGPLPPRTRYHVLDIEPMRQVLRSEGREAEVGQRRSLHICRGHFATYTEQHPLFGKYAGTFWKPMHVRGSRAVGTVEKAYRVQTPRAKED